MYLYILCKSKSISSQADAGGSPSLVARGFSTVQSVVGDQIEIQVPNEKVFFLFYFITDLQYLSIPICIVISLHGLASFLAYNISTADSNIPLKI